MLLNIQSYTDCNVIILCILQTFVYSIQIPANYTNVHAANGASGGEADIVSILNTFAAIDSRLLSI
jgi:hypothetical protein